MTETPATEPQATTDPAETTSPAPEPQATQTPASEAAPAPVEETAAPAPEEVVEAASPTELTTSEFARIDEVGNVYVIDEGGERIVGAYPEGLPADPLALYVRRFEDLQATVKLFEDRLATMSPKDIDQTLATITAAVVQPNAIGDLPGLRARVEAVTARAQERKEQAREERRIAKENALAERTALVERAEEVVAQDPERTHWKQSGQALRDLLEEWKAQQRRGPRLDKSVEDGLWKRFSAARTLFDRHRRQYFSALDQAQSEAKRIKEQLIAEAEALQTSTDWGATSAAYRALMDRWKVAPRASRKEDDALWARFRAAQQVFFDARRAKDQATDAEYRENLVAKEALLVEAEAIVPVGDLDAAKTALRSVQERWDEIGRVPSADHPRLDQRLRAVEGAVRAAEDREWRRTNPETRARAEGMLGQLEAQVARFEADLAAAEAAGNAKKTKELADTLATKKAWLEQIRSSMD
ncbi:DUF349 domain-containing protein [Schaalia sp. 19OD2882]|uniref:DUF349 domain-containing protein n=1 Tax=Schaalia sp. 19OD2882 TaxID=2794089 RepID=UPI001C1E992B|nr:DUF349 domain-containing protein [Schaalia sp. 19OD2882]QWW20476.1 DUF349 domain-containing protein [Schaalia sp. 19OD2882]